MEPKRTNLAGPALTLAALAPIVLAAQAAEEEPAVQSGPAPVVARSMPDVPEAPLLTTAESKIDVVFVLDTTGSMSGLIEGAKQKIWSIANAIALAEPRPEIRMGLVGYRDRGDEYVTRHTPLTADLDAIFADLMAFVAAGGGDGPESVNQALHEAVVRMDWDQDADALRMIYLVGDAEPHMDYADDVQYAESCALAATQGIFVNAIQCGSSSRTAEVWQEISRLAEGRYFSIDATGGVVAITTPFDAEMARLGQELDGTLVHYGTEAEQAAARERRASTASAAACAPEEALADRAAYCAGEAGKATLVGGKELVDEVLSGRVALNEIPESELPAELQTLAEPEREAFVRQKGQEREELQRRIQDLQRQREGFLKKELEARGDADGFDQRVLDALREQAAKKGITYEAPEGGTEPAPAPKAGSAKTDDC